MKNTPENKARFFAQYWGQDVLIHPDAFGKSKVCSEVRLDNSTAELKPLSQITDEDALTAYRFHYPENLFDESINEYDIKEAVEWLHHYGEPEYIKLTIEGADFLRSKGYALPWMGISVEELMEWGWVKLTNKTE